MSGGVPAAGRWSRVDTAALAVVTLVAGLVRAWRLPLPRGLVYDEFYAVDACRYLHGMARRCDVVGIPREAEISIAHPPLAKWLIAGSIRLFGFRPGGWRVAALVAGTVTVALVYLLARRLLGTTWGAALASGLLAVDLLHFTFSRTAMLDVFVALFVTAAVLCAVYHATAPAAADHRPGLAGLAARHRWALAAGAAVGAAGACKWSGWFVLPLVAVLLALPAVRGAGSVRDAARRVVARWPSLAVATVVVPMLVYTVTFLGRVDGSVLSWPWSDGSWASGFVDRQRTILDAHVGVAGGNPYASPGWTWPLLKRPLSLFFAEGADGRYVEVLALGSPVAWWAGMLALGWCAARAARRRGPRLAEAVVVGAVATLWVPWLVGGRGHEQEYLYYFLPAVPFLGVACAIAARDVAKRAAGRAATAVFAAACVAAFVFFHPVLAARPLDYGDWRARMIFRDCGPAAAGDTARLRPTARPGAPPEGWCWV